MFSLKRMVLMSLVVVFAISSHAAFAATTNLLRPNANGTYTGFAGAGGMWWQADFTRVDETACNGLTDYVYTMTTSTKESFTVDASWVSSTGSTITRIDIVPCASKASWNLLWPKLSKVNYFYRIDGVDYSSSSGDAWLPNITTPQILATSTYSSLNHNVSSTSNIQVGVEYTQCGIFGCGGVRLSNIAVKIYYD